MNETPILLTRQRHEAKKAGLHYDLRIVIGDKAFSWATKKEMPTPGKPILLFEQPTHTASYALSKHIVIPDGQYGAGETFLDFAQKGKAQIHDDAYHLDLNNGDRYLIKKMPEHYGDKAWLFLKKKDAEVSNKYLEKIAATTERKKSTGVKELAIGGYGVNTALKAPSKLLGYHTIYHGTSKENARHILQKGLRKEHGGTRGSKVSHAGPDAERHFTSQAKKHVYATRNKIVARSFAGDSAKHINAAGGSTAKAGLNSIKEGFISGKVLKARISHNQWKKGFEMDPDSFDFMTRMSKPAEDLKQIAARSKKNIESNQFSGGKGSKGAASFATKNNLRRYYGSKTGKVRALKGAAQLVGGAALAVGAAAHNRMNGGVLSEKKR